MTSATLDAAGLTSCQTNALDILARQGNVFLTGAAGTGKSFLLDKYLEGKPAELFPIVASTGAAAVLVGGRTFHSFFGLGILEGGVEAAVARALRSRKLVRRLNDAVCVIIDEVSMLSGATLAAAETVARRARDRDEPWGGLRIIAVGDFAQLPPVTPGAAVKDWAFLHDVWNASRFQPALMSTVMRTRDSDFLDILNFVRAGVVNDEVRNFLNGRQVAAHFEEEGTRLYPHRAKADEYNLRKLHSIRGETHMFRTEYAGEQRVLESAMRAFPIPDQLLLKIGALVMMRKNDVSGEGLYVNGSLGHVLSVADDVIEVRLLTGEDVEVEKAKFTYLDGDGNELMGAWNFPLTLAWATTIHKAQGASLDKMIVDLSSLWEPGQAYVALSRVRSSQGLFVERWNPRSIRAEKLVTDFYDGLAQEMKSYTPRPFFVHNIINPFRPQPEEGGVRERRGALIKERLAEGSSFEDIVRAAGVKPDRVLLYIEQFLEEGQSLSLGYLLEGIENVNGIRDAFENHGTARLKPAYEALGGTVDFTTLRLVRCVMTAEQGA